jgi:hypothetical protein
MKVVLPEIIVPGKRLGRHIDHDPRSLRYLLEATSDFVPIDSITWTRHIPILDQGNLGSCTGNALTGALGSGPLYDALAWAELGDPKGWLNEAEAVRLYSEAERIDGGAGYPPEDDGSSGLSVAKAAKRDGMISGYQHATSVGAAYTALKAGPFIVGSYWYSDMDAPSAEGIVKIGGQIRGGHEYVCRGYSVGRDLWWFDNSWGTGYGLGGSFAYDSATFSQLLANYGDVTSLVPISKPTPVPAPPPTTVTFTEDERAAMEDFVRREASWWTRYERSAAEAWKSATAQ